MCNQLNPGTPVYFAKHGSWFELITVLQATISLGIPQSDYHLLFKVQCNYPLCGGYECDLSTYVAI